MSKVFFIDQANPDFISPGLAALELLKTVAAAKGHSFAREIPIKVHFGERGNRTYVRAETYDPIIGYLKGLGAEPCFIESNVLYRGSRTTAAEHLRLAREHGFTQIPVVIADGEIGTDYDEIRIDKGFFRSCKIGKAYGRYGQFIVTSHFKGHIAAGFGGSLKQLAMGFAARSGKLEQHTHISPIVDKAECIACGLCVEKCDFGAITLQGSALIDPAKCVGCAGCIAVCPRSAISNSWEGVNFREKLAEYAYAATRGKDNIYISFVRDITEECDCVGSAMRPVTGDVGVLAGTDPVALDSACLDLVQKKAGRRIFDTGRETLMHAEEIGLGSTTYELVEIAPGPRLGAGPSTRRAGD